MEEEEHEEQEIGQGDYLRSTEHAEEKVETEKKEEESEEKEKEEVMEEEIEAEKKGEEFVPTFCSFKLLEKIDYFCDSYAFYNVAKLPHFWEKKFENSFPVRRKIILKFWEIQKSLNVGKKKKKTKLNWQFEFKKNYEQSNDYYIRKYQQVVKGYSGSSLRSQVILVWRGQETLLTPYFKLLHFNLRGKSVVSGWSLPTMFYQSRTNAFAVRVRKSFIPSDVHRIETDYHASTKQDGVFFFLLRSTDSFRSIENYYSIHKEYFLQSDSKFLLVGLLDGSKNLTNSKFVDYKDIYDLKGEPNFVDYIEINVTENFNSNTVIGLFLDEYNRKKFNLFQLKKGKKKKKKRKKSGKKSKKREENKKNKN